MYQIPHIADLSGSDDLQTDLGFGFLERRNVVKSKLAPPATYHIM